MSRLVRLTSAAERDLKAAVSWYRREAPHVVPSFRSALRESQRLIGENPGAYPLIQRGLRRAVVQRFPYSIFYRSREDDVLVVAIMHHARHPRVWEGRL